jgi:hypothetical protein
MPRIAIATLIAVAFAVTTAFPNPSNATEPNEPKKHHVKHRVAAVQYVAAPPQYYGMPGSYYPAPPFPFFLVPGPWWLPAHP